MDDDTLIIKGVRIDPSILRREAFQPCVVDGCMAVCCTGGVWLRPDEAPRIREWAAKIKACLPSERHDEFRWFEEGEPDEIQPGVLELGTATVDDPIKPDKTCCVFLQPDRKCALQVVSLVNKLGSPGLKPFFCAIYPLIFEAGVLSVDDETPLEFSDPTCRRKAPEARAMYELFRDETILVLGEDGYVELAKNAAATER